MRFSPNYFRYMRSSAWKLRRQRALALAAHRCQVCGERKRLQVHHVSYLHFGDEPDADLTVLCRACHFWATWLMRFRRWLSHKVESYERF